MNVLKGHIRTYLFFLALFSILSPNLLAQDTLRVHFLYGSVPGKGYKKSEKKLFGGIHGGHVSLGSSIGVYGFGPSGRFHIFGHRSEKRRHSFFQYEKFSSFRRDSVEKQYLTVYVPVDKKTMQEIDYLHACYYKDVPYDYAFLGMRCAASVAEILGQMEIIERRSRWGTWRKYFFPRKLRNRVVKLADEKGWRMVYREGNERRRWERDLRRTRRRIERNAIIQP